MSQPILINFDSHRPIREEVFLSLRNAILKGQFKLGERLVEKELAKKMGISRTPIREALRKLDLEGLVKYTPRKGVIVAGVSAKDALEIYPIRAVLEGLAARSAATNRSNEELAKLEDLLSKMKECIEKNTIDQFIAFHSCFHNTFAKASKNLRLYQMIISLRDYVRNFATISYSLSDRLLYGWEEHYEIADAIAKRDDERAERAAKTHIMQAKEAFLKAILSAEEKN
jgi:DNA-binding GntR family transcriptional regulator